MNVKIEQNDGTLWVDVYIEADEALSANKTIRAVMSASYFTSSPKVVVMVYTPMISKNVSDFILDISTLLSRYSAQKTSPLDLSLYVSPKMDNGYLALCVKTKGDTDKLNVVVITRNVEADNCYLPIDKIDLNSYLWINCLTPDESITMVEIYTRHSLSTNALTFIDSSNLAAEDIDYLMNQNAPMVFIDSVLTTDGAISDNKAYASVNQDKVTSRLFLREELTGSAISATVTRLLDTMMVTDTVELASLEPEVSVSNGILTLEEDVHFTVIIDKKGNKTLKIDVGGVAILVDDTAFVNDKLASMKTVAKTTLDKMYPYYNCDVDIADGKLFITSPDMKSGTLALGIDPTKQQIEYVLSRTVYFAMCIGRFLKGDIGSIDLGAGIDNREKWYQSNIKYIIQ